MIRKANQEGYNVKNMYRTEQNCADNFSRKTLRDLGVDWKRVFRWCGLNSSDSGQGPVAGSCKHGSENLGPIRGGESFDQLSDYQYLKDSAPAISSSVVYCKQETFLNLTL
jgi:hypothetical protein